MVLSLSDSATSGFSGRRLRVFEFFPRLILASGRCDDYKVTANDFFRLELRGPLYFAHPSHPIATPLPRSLSMHGMQRIKS